MSGQRSRSEDTRLHAATAQIEVLAGREVSGPARNLVNTVIEVHSMIAAGTGVEEATVAKVDRRRYEVIELFKADLGLKTRPQYPDHQLEGNIHAGHPNAAAAGTTEAL